MIILGTNSIKDTGFNVANSCRFNDGDSACMHKTPSSSGNRRTFTSADGKTDILVFKYNGAVWQEVGRTLNLSES